MTATDRTYLGDGLYAEFDGFAFKLIAPRDGEDHWVYMEPEVFDSFMRYVREKWNVDITIKDKAAK